MTTLRQKRFWETLIVIALTIGICCIVGLLTSCDNPYKDIDSSVEWKNVSIDGYVGKIGIVEFEGHQYVCWVSAHRGSLTHSPDCVKCHGKNDNE